MNVENTLLHRETAVPAIEALDANRPRSTGVLSRHQIEWCRGNGIALAFDPLQGGWVTSDCTDDLSESREAEAQYDTGGFVFRSWTQKDAATYARMLSSERLWEFLPETYTGPIDTTTAAALIELGNETHHSVSAVEKDGIAIGQARLRFDAPGTAEVSYWLGEEHWGKGFGSLIVAAYCDQCFRDRPEIERLFARVHKGNLASRRVLEKAAFVHVCDDGDWQVLERRSTN